MTKPSLPSAELLRKILKYDPETGKLFWRERPVDMFSTKRAFGTWNTRFSDKEAFISNNGDGYNQGGIFDRLYLAHRVIWAMETGKWPVDQIDHINGVRDDNRMVSLRDVDNQENQRNMSMPSDNKSGTIGVCMCAVRKKWRSYVRVDGITKHLGYFTNIEDAIAARASANIKYGFHNGHGKGISN